MRQLINDLRIPIGLANLGNKLYHNAQYLTAVVEVNEKAMARWLPAGMKLVKPARAERSLINLAMISALNRPNELKLHVKGALRNGVTKEKIREVLLQVTIYCGVPAGVDSFRIAKEAIAEYERENG